MYVVGIRVVDETDGSPIGFRRAAIRFGVWLVGAWCLFIGWLWG